MPALVQQFPLAADRLLVPYTVKAAVSLILYYDVELIEKQ